MESWVTKSISDVICKTKTVDPRKYPEDEFLYVDVSGVSNQTLEITESTKLAGKDAPSRARRVITEGDIIFATVRPTLKRIAVVPSYLDGEVCSTGYFVFQPKSELYNRYLFYFLQSDNFMGEMEKLQKGASYPAVNDTQVKSRLISYPPIPEQKRIVALLDTVFADLEQTRAKTEQNLKNARELFDSYLQQVFSQKGEDIKSIPLGELVEVLTDYHANGSYKVLKQHVELSEQEDFAWMVRSTDFEKKFQNAKRYISEHAYNYLTKSKLYGGEIIMSKIGNAGKVYLMPATDRACSLAMNLFLIRLDGTKANNEYVYRYLNSSSGKAQIAPRLKGAATQTITKDNVRSLLIPLPSLVKQQEHILALQKLEVETKTLETLYLKKLDRIDELKKSILQKAFSGELTTTTK